MQKRWMGEGYLPNISETMLGSGMRKEYIVDLIIDDIGRLICEAGVDSVSAYYISVHGGVPPHKKQVVISEMT